MAALRAPNAPPASLFGTVDEVTFQLALHHQDKRFDALLGGCLMHSSLQ